MIEKSGSLILLLLSMSFHALAQSTDSIAQVELPIDEENLDEVAKSGEEVSSKSYTAIIGKNYFNYEGSSYDTPRDFILGVSRSDFFCDGYCETFYELTGGTGERSTEVKLEVIGVRLRGGFLYNPINTKWIIFGLGPDISLRYDRVSNTYRNIVSKDSVFSAELALSAKIRFRLGDNDNRHENSMTKYLVLSYRAFAQTVLSSCKKTSDTDAPFEGCRNHEALQTYEKYLIHGGGYEVYLGLEFRY